MLEFVVGGSAEGGGKPQNNSQFETCFSGNFEGAKTAAQRIEGYALNMALPFCLGLAVKL